MCGKEVHFNYRNDTFSLCEQRDIVLWENCWSKDKQKEVKAKSDLEEHKHVLCDTHKLDSKCSSNRKRSEVTTCHPALPSISSTAQHHGYMHVAEVTYEQ